MKTINVQSGSIYRITWNEIATILPTEVRNVVENKLAQGPVPFYLINTETGSITGCTPMFSNENHNPSVVSPLMEDLGDDVLADLHKKGLISYKEAKAILGVSDGRMMKMHRAGVLPFKQEGYVRIAYLKADVQAMKQYLDVFNANHVA